MKAIIQDISEITDSRELLESKPYPFVTIFIYIVMSILLATLSWSYFSEIDIVVKANGIVRPNEKISTITNKVTGKVDKVYFENGQKVKKGDILYIINYDDLKLQESSLLKDLNKNEIKLKNLYKFKDSILDNKNYFDLSSKDEEEYYYKYLKYSMDLQKLKEDTTLIITQIKNTNDTIKNLETLLSSINKEENLFKDPNNEYSIKYQDYLLKTKELNNLITESKETFETQLTLKESGAISENAFKKIKSNYESALLSLEKFKNETLLNIKSSLESSKKQIEELQIQLRRAIPNKYSGLDNSDDFSINFKTENLIVINDSINNLENEIDFIKKNIETTKLNIEKCIVKSPIDGYVNVIVDINKGDNVLSGTKIATILPDNDSEYKVEIFIPNKDISNISIGDKIKYHFYALPYKEYGELNGTITKISVDSRMNESVGNSFYLVEANIENRPLYSYKGERAEIKVGMACEAQVITKTKKILFYLLEKIDLWD